MVGQYVLVLSFLLYLFQQKPIKGCLRMEEGGSEPLKLTEGLNVNLETTMEVTDMRECSLQGFF